MVKRARASPGRADARAAASKESKSKSTAASGIGAIPQADIDRAIEAALRGEILHDEEIDSDEASGEESSSAEVEEDEEEDDEYDDEDDDSLLINDDDPDASDSDPSESDQDPDEGDIDYADDSDSDAEPVGPRIRVVKGADGQPRVMRPEIQPGYDSDSSTDEPLNTVGDIDMSLYDTMPHIGYDISGKRIMRPAVGKALDSMLDTIEAEAGYTGVMDQDTGLDVKLSPEELDIIKRIRRAELPDADYNAYEDYIDGFSGVVMKTPLSNAPEPKRRFVPSKHEQKRVMRIVRAIREGRIVPKKPEDDKKIDERLQKYDVWADEAPVPDHIMKVRAPKVAPPGHAESYNPPAEYLPTEEEAKAWKEADKEDRDRDFLPKKYSSLRLVPGYTDGVQERFERCLDLYLAPRLRRKKLDIDPESLIPQLPSPQDLRPFPTRTSHVMRGHEGAVRCVDVSPSGDWIASGGEDGTLRIWEVVTGRLMQTIELSKDDTVSSVQWNPSPEVSLVCAAAGESLFLVCPTGVFSEDAELATKEVTERGASIAAARPQSESGSGACKWLRPLEAQRERGVLLRLETRNPIKHIDWHRRGDYLVSTSPEQSASAVLVHQLSKHLSQAPFARPKGSVQCTVFHPTRPHLFVASQRYIRVYDLQKQQLVRTLQPGLRWISSISVHPSGDHVVVGSYDKKVAWFDLDLGATPWKTLRYHAKAVRSVVTHARRPLFATASDDGTIQIFHAQVFADLARDPLLVPLKILRGHKIDRALGVLDVAFAGNAASSNMPAAGPAWCVSAGADGTLRLWS
ncbi:Ribosome bioproteinsis protein erb1 [Savitreella phatthalungensis]